MQGLGEASGRKPARLGKPVGSNRNYRKVSGGKKGFPVTFPIDVFAGQIEKALSLTGIPELFKTLLCK